MARRALIGPKNDTLGGVTRALRVLDVFARSGSEGSRSLSARAIATSLGINLSTCYHVLNTLMAEGYIVRDPDSALLSLGPKVAALARAYDRQLGLTPEVNVILRDLARECGENVVIAFLQRDLLVIMDVIESIERVRVAGMSPGVAEHLHARSLGKAVLAYKDDAIVEQHFVQDPPLALTSNTRTSLGDIRAELKKTRARGHSEDIQEFAEGVCGIAAAFFQPGGEVAGSVAVSFPILRFEEKNARIIALVRGAAKRITEALAASLDATPSLKPRLPRQA